MTRSPLSCTCCAQARAAAPRRSTPLPVRLTPAGSPDAVDGIALSPDGSRLGVALQVPTNGFHPRGKIQAFLRAPYLVDSAGPQRGALPWDPAWTGARQSSSSGRTTSDWPTSPSPPGPRCACWTPPHPAATCWPPVSSRPEVAGWASSRPPSGPGGGPVIASVYRNVPATGTNGTATVRLVALSTQTGKVISVLRRPHGALSRAGAAEHGGRQLPDPLRRHRPARAGQLPGIRQARPWSSHPAAARIRRDPGGSLVRHRDLGMAGAPEASRPGAVSDRGKPPPATRSRALT